METKSQIEQKIKFHGEYEYTMDDKGRVSIPSKMRKLIKEHKEDLIMFNGFQNCIEIYPLSNWDIREKEIKDKFEKNQTKNSMSDSYMFDRTINSRLMTLSLDSQHRVTIPKKWCENKFKGMKDMAIVGSDLGIELWSAEKYKTQALSDSQFENLVEGKT